jgi:hypothetical protein
MLFRHIAFALAGGAAIVLGPHHRDIAGAADSTIPIRHRRLLSHA